MDNKDLYLELKEIRTLLSEVRIILARNTDSLDYHVKRTDLLEKHMTIMEKDLLKVRGFFSIGGWVLGIAATALTIFSKIYGW